MGGPSQGPSSRLSERILFGERGCLHESHDERPPHPIPGSRDRPPVRRRSESDSWSRPPLLKEFCDLVKGLRRKAPPSGAREVDFRAEEVSVHVSQRPLR